MTSEKKFLIFSTLIALGLFSANALFLFETHKKAQSAREMIALGKIAEGDAGGVQKIESALEETKGEQEKLSAYFVKKGGAVYFIEQLEGIGKLAGLSISLSNVSVSKMGTSLSADMATEGSFEDTFYFLTMLENLPYKIFVEKATIRKKEGFAGSSGDFQAPPAVSSSRSSGKTGAIWTGSFTVVLESFINS